MCRLQVTVRASLKEWGGGSEPDSSLTNEMNFEMDPFLAMHCLMRKLMSTTFKTGNPLVNLSGMVISMVFSDLLMRKAFGNSSRHIPGGSNTFPHEDSYRFPHEESLGEVSL